jgi:hypothetical protein
MSRVPCQEKGRRRLRQQRVEKVVHDGLFIDFGGARVGSHIASRIAVFSLPLWQPKYNRHAALHGGMHLAMSEEMVARLGEKDDKIACVCSSLERMLSKSSWAAE